MLHTILQVSFVSLVWVLSIPSSQSQTLSNCRPTPPMGENAKPGIGGLSLSHDGKTLLVAAGDGKVRFVDMATGDVQRTLTGHTNMVYSAIFSPDEKLLGSSSRDRTARIWEVATGQELRKLEGFRCSVKAVAFSPSGLMLAASGNDGMLKLWDVKTGRELKSLVHKDSSEIDMATYAFVFSRDGKKIYAGNGDGTISEWEVMSGKETRVWKAHENTAFRLLFSPDYRLLASFGDSIVKIWDTSTWREVRSLAMPRTAGASSFSSSIAISHNGRLIAASNVDLDSKQSAYLDVPVVVWDMKTGEKLFTLNGHKFDVNGLVFTRDDRFLLTGSVDRTIKFWDMRTGQTTRTIMMSTSESKAGH
jgi:WD40 repeat protein